MRVILALAVLFFMPVQAFADVCPSGALMASSALVGATCTAIPPQKSYIYPPAGNAVNGFSTTVPDGVTIWILNAATLLATGTIILPANPTDGQPLSLECPKGVTLASVNANTGQNLSGINITTCTVATPYRLKYSGINSTWYPN